MRNVTINWIAFIAIVFSLLLVSSNSVKASTYYVAVNGNDNNPGTLSQPFASWQKGATVAIAGDIVFIRGGVYSPSGRYWGMRKDGKSGSAGKPISMRAYPGETPIMDCSKLTIGTGSWGIELINSSWWHLKGLHIRGVSQQGTSYNVMGIRISHCNNIIIEECEFSRIQGMGMAIYGASENNYIINCDSHHNYDPNGNTPGGDADGFVIGTISERGRPERINYIKGCRAWNNSDDGFDFWENEGTLYVDSCWAWNSGYNQGNGNGIKLGQANGTKETTPQRYINNCLLFYNKVDGFDNSEADILMSFLNNTVYRNGGRGYDFGQYNNPLIFKNNISYRNSTTDRFPAATVHNHNSWDASPGVTISDADFLSVDTTGVSRKRVNGKLPSLNFLKLAANSDLVNAGTNVNLPYQGSAPDLGCNESSVVPSSIKVNSITVTGANGAKTISTYRGTLQVSSAILPANATNKTIAWTVQNGTGQATISTSGLVTASSNGTVTARATANDGSGVTGTLIITISNQIVVQPTTGTYYVATNGNDNNPGTITQPFATWQKGATVAQPGNVVYIRGGVYTPSGTYWGMRKDGKSGTAGKPITIRAYPGETPIMDCSKLTVGTGSWGIELINSSWWHLKGLHIRGVSQRGTSYNVMGIRISHCNNIIIEECEFYKIQGMGMAIYGASENNHIINCDSHHNYDPNGTTPGGDADGFVIGTISERGKPERINYIRGCRAWNNSDDGFDFWENEGTLYVDSCWAWNSGYNQGNGNGIKLGQANGTKETTPQRYINNCLLFYNKVDGFDNSEADILMSFLNNTVYRNGGRGYDFGQYNNALIFKNNISYRNSTTDRFPSATVHSNNSWDASPSVTISDADFLSVDTTGVSGKRVNGKLPSLNFLKLAANSDLVNAGTDVKIPFFGNAPDIGYHETSMEASNQPEAARKSSRITTTGSIIGVVSPNPFRDGLAIEYNLPGDTHVNLVIYDLNGRIVRQLVNETQAEGAHRFQWDALNSNGNGLRNGIYLLKLECEFGTETSKIIYSE